MARGWGLVSICDWCTVGPEVSLGPGSRLLPLAIAVEENEPHLPCKLLSWKTLTATKQWCFSPKAPDAIV